MTLVHLAKTTEAQKSGPLGLLLILLLCVACYFLFKSMSKHLRKVREEFPAELPPPPGTATALPPQPGVAEDRPEDDPPVVEREDAPLDQGKGAPPHA